MIVKLTGEYPIFTAVNPGKAKHFFISWELQSSTSPIGTPANVSKLKEILKRTYVDDLVFFKVDTKTAKPIPAAMVDPSLTPQDQQLGDGSFLYCSINPLNILRKAQREGTQQRWTPISSSALRFQSCCGAAVSVDGLSQRTVRKPFGYHESPPAVEDELDEPEKAAQEAEREGEGEDDKEEKPQDTTDGEPVVDEQQPPAAAEGGEGDVHSSKEGGGEGDGAATKPQGEGEEKEDIAGGGGDDPKKKAATPPLERNEGWARSIALGNTALSNAEVRTFSVRIRWEHDDDSVSGGIGTATATSLSAASGGTTGAHDGDDGLQDGDSTVARAAAAEKAKALAGINARSKAASDELRNAAKNGAGAAAVPSLAVGLADEDILLLAGGDGEEPAHCSYSGAYMLDILSGTFHNGGLPAGSIDSESYCCAPGMVLTFVLDSENGVLNIRQKGKLLLSTSVPAGAVGSLYPAVELFSEGALVEFV